MAAESYRVVVLMVAVVAATALQLISAASPVTYTVGDSIGWTVPADGAAAYQTWAKKHTFTVGDILVFNFINGTHNVAAVAKTAYDTCNAATTQSLFNSAPVRITLTTPGQHFFICTFPGHCSMGQQLAIDVVAATTPPTSSPTIAPSSSAPTAFPPSSQGSAPPPSSTSAPTATPLSSSPTAAPPSTTTATPPSSPNAAPPTSPTAAPPSTTVTPTPSSSANLPPSVTAAPSPIETATSPTTGNSAVGLGITGTVLALMLSAFFAFV